MVVMKVEDARNDDGTISSKCVCNVCGVPYSITPSVEGGVLTEKCLSEYCPSYDPSIYIGDQEYLWKR